MGNFQGWTATSPDRQRVPENPPVRKTLGVPSYELIIPRTVYSLWAPGPREGLSRSDPNHQITPPRAVGRPPGATTGLCPKKLRPDQSAATGWSRLPVPRTGSWPVRRRPESPRDTCGFPDYSAPRHAIVGAPARPLLPALATAARWRASGGRSDLGTLPGTHSGGTPAPRSTAP